MEWQNELSRTLKIQYPIVQSPMLGVTTPEMVAAISNEGALGSLPVGGLAPAQTAALIRQTKSLTDKPFGVNLFAHTNAAPDRQQVEAMHHFLEKLCVDNQITYGKLDFESLHFTSYQEQIQVLVDEEIPVVSFTFGILDEDLIKALREKGVVLIGTATSLPEAILLEEKGIHIITAQGLEAGGHRGTFLDTDPYPLIGLMSLVPLLADHLRQPILAAGGIHDGRSIKAAFILGAKGVQIGSAFIASPESGAMAAYKTSIREAAQHDTVLTKAFSGRLARSIRNKFIAEVERSGLAIPAYPVQGSLIAAIRSEAQKQNNKDFTGLLAGQSSFSAQALPAAEILLQLIKQTEAIS